MTISNSDDIIDSRDVIERIEELESQRQDAIDRLADLRAEFEAIPDNVGQAEADEMCRLGAAIAHAEKEVEEFDSDESDFRSAEGYELRALKALADEASQYADDWRHGAALIRESHFVEYAEQLADDLGFIKSNVSWPYDCIDWEKAADQLRVDYTEVDYEGVSYLIR